MTVTGIKEFDKSRVEIEIDDTYTFILYKGEVRTYGIKENQELSEDNYRKIMEEVLPKRAKMRAMNLLKNRSYTAFQLREKLQKGGYPGCIIKEALDYVTGFGYVNDKRYAADYIEYHKEMKSRNRIYMDLIKRGISKEIFESTWLDIVGEDKKELEKEQIISWMRKNILRLKRRILRKNRRWRLFYTEKGLKLKV